MKQVKTVAATETETLLDNLDMFTQYNLIMLAFNAAGDGPNTTVVIAARTFEGGGCLFLNFKLTTVVYL